MIAIRNAIAIDGKMLKALYYTISFNAYLHLYMFEICIRNISNTAYALNPVMCNNRKYLCFLSAYLLLTSACINIFINWLSKVFLHIVVFVGVETL